MKCLSLKTEQVQACKPNIFVENPLVLRLLEIFTTSMTEAIIRVVIYPYSEFLYFIFVVQLGLEISFSTTAVVLLVPPALREH